MRERIRRTRGIPACMDQYPDLTRVAVIDHRPADPSQRPPGTRGLVFTADQRDQPPFGVELSWQDEGRTLKIFLSGRPQPKEQQ